MELPLSDAFLYLLLISKGDAAAEKQTRNTKVIGITKITNNPLLFLFFLSLLLKKIDQYSTS